MKNDITKLTAYEIGILLEKRKIDPISLLESFLENYNFTEDLIKRIPFPKKPKKIFTCLGILRSTLMDRYIAKNVETLILKTNSFS